MISTRHLEFKDGVECVMDIPYHASLDYIDRGTPHAISCESHAHALEMYHAKLAEWDDEGAVELTPWILFASPTYRCSWHGLTACLRTRPRLMGYTCRIVMR